MSKARLVITAVLIERRPVAEVAREYAVARSWIYTLLARYRAEGDAAFQPRSRRPHQSPRSLPGEVVERIVQLRQQLTAAGLDAGAHTIAWHLQQHHQVTVAPATIWRHLKTAGLITAEPKKKPKTAYIRFEAALPNECWQSDFTHITLADGTPTGADTEVLTFLDDHSRYALSVTAHHRVTGPIVVAAFRETLARHGIPASTLTDNGMVYTARYAGGRGPTGNTHTGFEADLARLGIVQKNSRPNHPTTCGKVERFQQTLKKWLRQQPRPPATIDQLQQLLDLFVDEYNHRRPHRSLDHRTPAAAYTSRPKAGPGDSTDGHYRIRRDIVDNDGKLTLRHAGRLHHIGIGAAHRRTPVLMLVHHLDIKIINAATGATIRQLTLDPTRDYQGRNTRKPKTP